MSRPALLVLVLVLGSACDFWPEEPQEPLDTALPSGPFCDAVRAWPEAQRDLEDALIERIDEHRARGRDCDGVGRFEPALPLRDSGPARCAARVHALDMAQGDFVGHLGSDDSTPWDRLRAAGVDFAVADQVIAAGAAIPEEIVDALWLPRPGSCAALMASDYENIGIGVAAGPQTSPHEVHVVAIVWRAR